MHPRLSTIYGPVKSWRVGWSLGIDLICQAPVCSFNCYYCQLGNIFHHTAKRSTFVPTTRVIEDLEASAWHQADIITFSGNGEPTLAENLGECIREVRARTKKPTLVLTNGVLLCDPDVVRDLCLADRVYVKLDAADEATFVCMNRPVAGVTLNGVIESIRRFKKIFRGYLGIQTMLTPVNVHQAEQLAEIFRSIKPDEIQINTPTRPYPQSQHVAARGSHGTVPYPAVALKGLSASKIYEVAELTRRRTNLKVISVFSDKK